MYCFSHCFGLFVTSFLSLDFEFSFPISVVPVGISTLGGCGSADFDSGGALVDMRQDFGVFIAAIGARTRTSSVGFMI